MHDHTAHHGPCRTANNLRTAFWLNLGFTVLEIIGGLLTNSVAILSDAVHDLGDSLSLGMAWYLQRMSGRARDTLTGFSRDAWQQIEVDSFDTEQASAIRAVLCRYLTTLLDRKLQLHDYLEELGR